MTAAPLRIFWAEDNAQDRNFIHESIGEETKARLTFFPDGIGLVEGLRQTTPDLVVLDLKMPRLGGIEALRTIRGHAAWKALPVVIFSSGERPDEIAACRAFGVLDVVQKPLDFDVFVTAVQRIVDPDIMHGKSVEPPTVALPGVNPR